MSFTPEVRQAGVQVRQARAVAWAADLAPIVKELQAAGITSLKGIAMALDERGVPTPTGRGYWHAVQVSRLVKRLPA
jgi:hypothetical protein